MQKLRVEDDSAIIALTHLNEENELTLQKKLKRAKGQSLLSKSHHKQWPLYLLIET